MSETTAPAEIPVERLTKIQRVLTAFGAHGIPASDEEAEAEIARAKANVLAVFE